jgi:hypothetical protein
MSKLEYFKALKKKILASKTMLLGAFWAGMAVLESQIGILKDTLGDIGYVITTIAVAGSMQMARMSGLIKDVKNEQSQQA